MLRRPRRIGLFSSMTLMEKILFGWQGCIETAITKDGGGVCPKCYRSAKLDDLVPVGGGDNWIPVVGGVSGAVSALGGAKQEPIYSEWCKEAVELMRFLHERWPRCWLSR